MNKDQINFGHCDNNFDDFTLKGNNSNLKFKTVAFHTLGCKLNFTETSTIGRLFVNNGFKKVDPKEKPDVFILNTCSVTENADDKCKKIVNDLYKVSPNTFTIITGCFAQLKPDAVSKIKGVDAVIGSNEKFKIFDLISSFEKKNKTEVHVGNIFKKNEFQTSYSSNDRTRSFLKVQDGCDYYCSFCTIPFARGRSRSDKISNVIYNIKKLEKENIKEIVLTGINLGDFGIVNSTREASFFELIQEIGKLDTKIRFRISSIEPNLLSDEIIEFVSKSKSFVPHFHIPLQSGSDEVLKMMKRKYDTKLYLSRLSLIEKSIPDCCIGADVIVGFPNETEERFLETYEFIKNSNISYLHVFPYSERLNTKAIKMEQIPWHIRIKRAKMLRILSEKKKREFYNSNIGKIKTVLFEKAENRDNSMMGFTENYLRVETNYNEKLVNTFQNILINEIDGDCHVKIKPNVAF